MANSNWDTDTDPDSFGPTPVISERERDCREALARLRSERVDLRSFIDRDRREVEDAKRRLDVVERDIESWERRLVPLIEARVAGNHT